MDDSVSSLDSDVTVAEKPATFRFFDLPAELRLRIFELLLTLPETYVVDLDPQNCRRLAPIFLPVFLTSHRFHDEASAIFFRTNTFRLFPTHGRFFHTKRPLLSRLPAVHRAQATTLELRLGPGWTKPPRGWVVNDALGLQGATKLRRLNVFVECDPASHDVFRGFRPSETFYTDFCVGLIRDIFAAAPAIKEIEFDGYPSVHKDSPLMVALKCEAKAEGKRVTWGAQFRGQEELEAVLSRISSLTSLSDAMAVVGISEDVQPGFGVQAAVQQVLSEA